MADLLVRDVRIHGGPLSSSITIRGGSIEAIGDPPAEWSGLVVDGAGALAIPGLVDGHAHLDKTLWGLPWRPHSAGPGLAGLIQNERAGRRDLLRVNLGFDGETERLVADQGVVEAAFANDVEVL